MRIVKTLIVCAVGMFCFGMSAYAADGDYVVVLKNAPTAELLDVDCKNENCDGRVIVTDSYMDALSIASSSEVMCIFEDAEASLLDDDETSNDYDSSPVNDPYYSKQKLDIIQASYAWEEGATGDGVTVGVVDSGMRRESHEDLRVPEKYFSVLGDYMDYGDSYGHGTKVSGIIGAIANNGIGIAGVAPDANLVPVKVTNEETMYTSDVVRGFEKAVDFGCEVINMSIGYSKKSDSNPKGASASTIKAINTIVQDAIDKGIIIVAAAGNDASTVYQYPASYENVVSVASIGTVSSLTESSTFSQHNDQVTVTAPGYQICTTTASGGYSSNNDGTSFSAPMVTGAAAMAKQIDPDITAEEFIAALAETSTDIYTEGYDEYTGYGILNIRALTDYLSNGKPIPTHTPAPSSTPEPSKAPEESPTPIPEYSSLKFNETTYTLTAVHEPISSKTRIIAAFYEGERLYGIKIVYGVEGNTVNIINYKTDADITKAELFAWDYSDEEKPEPMILKQTVSLN